MKKPIAYRAIAEAKKLASKDLELLRTVIRNATPPEAKEPASAEQEATNDTLQ